MTTIIPVEEMIDYIKANIDTFSMTDIKIKLIGGKFIAEAFNKDIIPNSEDGLGFVEMLSEIKNGKKFTKKSWPTVEVIFLYMIGNNIFINIGSFEKIDYYPKWSDMVAHDWKEIT